MTEELIQAWEKWDRQSGEATNASELVDALIEFSKSYDQTSIYVRSLIAQKRRDGYSAKAAIEQVTEELTPLQSDSA